MKTGEPQGHRAKQGPAAMATSSSEGSKTPSARIAGFMEANVVAILALLLSVGSVGWHLYNYFRGAQVHLVVSDRINLMFSTDPTKPDIPFLLINAGMNYVNKGAIGSDAVVVGELLHIYLPDSSLPHEYRWMHFETVVPNRADRTPEYTNVISAHTTLIPGAGVETHQTTFAAFEDASVPPLERARAAWIRRLSFQRLVQEDTEILFRFISFGLEGRVWTDSCRVVMRSEALDQLYTLGWTTSYCAREGSPTKEETRVRTPSKLLGQSTALA